MLRELNLEGNVNFRFLTSISLAPSPFPLFFMFHIGSRQEIEDTYDHECVPSNNYIPTFVFGTAKVTLRVSNTQHS